MCPENDNHADSELEVPPALKEELRAIARPGFDVPGNVDVAIGEAAHCHFRSAARHRIVRLWAPIAAAAAAILLVFALGRYEGGRAGTPGIPVHASARRPDTILDAFALARRLKAGERPGPEWDYNADGTVDDRDVHELAMAAVRLEQGT